MGFKKGDKVMISDYGYEAYGTIHSVRLKARTPYVIKKESGGLIGALAKDIKRR